MTDDLTPRIWFNNGVIQEHMLVSTRPFAGGTEYVPADALTAAQARIAELEAERDDWKAGFGKILSSVPLPDVLKASGTIGDAIDYIKKSLEGDAEAEQRGRLQGLDEAWLAVYLERLHDNTGAPDDLAYNSAIDDAMRAIEALKTKGQEQ